jgi:ABC-type sugar transport system ATPase subunit
MFIVAGFVGSPAMNLIDEGDVTLGVRPEDVELSTVEQPGFAAARVWVTEEMGNETIVVLAAGDKRITARAPADSRWDFDASVWFRFRPDKIHRFERRSGDRVA